MSGPDQDHEPSASSFEDGMNCLLIIVPSVVLLVLGLLGVLD